MAQIKFNSWQREGIGNSIQAGSVSGRPQIGLKVTINGQAPEEKRFQIIGPGDLLGFSKDLVIRTEPVDWNTNFPPNLLAHLEFYDEDFPWRYSPGAAKPEQTQLDPWLALIVLKEDEFKLGAQVVPLPFIELSITAKLPSLSDNHLWAHVQEMRADNAKNPDRIISRLLCPRKLEPNTPYHAFVVPSYENGRRAGLGQEEAGINAPATAPSWDVTNLGGWKLPVYYQWYFHTGNNVDFEYLGDLLEPRDLNPMVGRKKLDCSKPGFGIRDYTTPFTLYLEGALKAANKTPALDAASADNLDNVFAPALRGILNPPVASAADPVLAPPFYGQKHIAEPSFDPAKPTWIHQINRNPAQRAPAGLGVQLLRKYQDHYMQKAWEQVESVAKANKIIETAASNLAVSQSLYDKHFNPLMTRSYSATDKFYTGMALMAPVHAKVKGRNMGFNNNKTDATLQYLIKNNNQNASMYGTAFRRTTRKRGTFYKKLGRNGTSVDFSKLVLQPKENDLPVAKPMDGLFIDLPTVNLKFDADAIAAFNKMVQPPPSSSNTNRLSFKESIEPRYTFSTVLNNMLEMPPGFGSFTHQEDSIKPALAYPDFEDPMYLKLIELSPEYLIPNLHLIPNNTVALLESNQAFIESFMVGLNVEMCREMRWREYPTDERASCFRQFWDMKGLKNATGLSDAEAFKDITPIHTWKKQVGEPDTKNALGAHNNRPGKAGDNQLVLALRGDLFKCFPDASVYMMKAKLVTGTKEFELDPAAGNLKFPAFKAEVGADVKLLGFDMSVTEAKSSGTAPGWFFIFQETPGETRFGMDINAPDVSNKKKMEWDDLSWTMFQPPLHFIETKTPPVFVVPSTPPDLKWPPDDHWAVSSADMAFILYQKPVMIAIHADELLDTLTYRGKPI